MGKEKTEALLAEAVESGRFDLHVHTTVSDGSLTFAQALAQARERGIAYVAFTNHDTVRGLSEAVELGRDFGVTVIPGIEVSAWDEVRKRKVHVLGFGLSDGSTAVERLCAPLRARRDAASRWQLERLVGAGYSVDAERALSYAQDSGVLYKQHIMAALTDAPHPSREYKDLYRSLFKGSGICAREIAYVDARDAVRAIAADGGVPVLAHPGQLDSYGMVGELAACGLRGIERLHPDHGPHDWAVCDELAKRYGLVCTGGSDYHGAFGDVPCLGYGIVA